MLATLFLAILFCFASCFNNSTTNNPITPEAPTTSDDNQGSEDSDTDYSLGDAPDESKKFSEDYFTDKKSEDGIYLEFTVPAGTDQSRVYIDGVGQVSEGVWRNESGNKGSFFYPFLDPNKEYTIRIVFMRQEDKDDNGFVIGHVGSDGTIGWFQTKVTAGAKSKGEVLVKDHGEIKVENNGDFKFTKRPSFENENLLTGSDYDWMMDVALVEGVSWMHEGRKTKWGVEIEIPQKSITETHNLYTIEYYWKNDDFSKIDFVCHRPVLHYKYDGKEYKYLWYSDVMDTPELKTESDLYTNIDITKSADIEKIKGTWICKGEWSSNNVYEVQQRKLEIGDTIVKHNEFIIYTKPDGKAFANGELLENQYKWCFTYEDSALLSEAEEFEANLKNDPKIFDFEKTAKDEEKYTYKIWRIYDHFIRSSDGKTITWVNDYELPVSEYFKEHIDDNGRTLRYDNLALFVDGNTLKAINYLNDYGKTYTYRIDYKKQ